RSRVLVERGSLRVAALESGGAGEEISAGRSLELGESAASASAPAPAVEEDAREVLAEPSRGRHAGKRPHRVARSQVVLKALERHVRDARGGGEDSSRATPPIDR